jgi:hypothetical protein
MARKPSGTKLPSCATKRSIAAGRNRHRRRSLSKLRTRLPAPALLAPRPPLPYPPQSRHKLCRIESSVPCRHGRGTHQDSVTRANVGSNAIGCVDHRPRLEQHRPTCSERPSTQPRQTQRRARAPGHLSNHRFGRAPRRFGSNSAAHHGRLAIFKKTIAPPVVLRLSASSSLGSAAVLLVPSRQ